MVGIINFLISHKCYFANEFSTALTAERNVDEMEDLGREKTIECRRLLLRAGADPTIEASKGGWVLGSGLDDAIYTGTLVS